MISGFGGIRRKMVTKSAYSFFRKLRKLTINDPCLEKTLENACPGQSKNFSVEGICGQNESKFGVDFGNALCPLCSQGEELQLTCFVNVYLLSLFGPASGNGLGWRLLKVIVPKHFSFRMVESAQGGSIKGKVWNSLYLGILWSICKHRNEVTFKDKVPSLYLGF